MIPKINSAHGSETRNIINELISLFNRMGYTYDDALKRAHDILNEAKKTNDMNESVQNQINTLIAESGTSASEVLQARFDAEGNEYPVLKERLDSQDTYVDLARREASQPDYVEMLSKYAQTGEMQIMKINSGGAFEVSVFDDSRHITYRFMAVGDDYITQAWVWGGDYNSIIVPYDETIATSMDFNFSNYYVLPTSGVVGYTQTVGDTFEYTFDVTESDSQVSFTFYKNNRGGRWRLTLNGVNTFICSTYSSTTKVEEDITFEGLSIGNHTIVAEFIGDDPQNPPQTEPSRGWIQNTSRSFFKVGRKGIEPNKDHVFKNPSNIEFAFEVNPLDANNAEFIPSHGEETGISASPPKVRDGNKIININSMSNSDIVLVEDFSLEQHIYGRNPESGSRNLMEIWTVSKIDRHTGILNIDGKRKTLEDLNFVNAYSIMGVAEGVIFDTLITSYKNQYEMNQNYGNNIPMREEGEKAESFAFLSSSQKDMAIAFRFNNIKETLRQGADGKDENSSTMTYLNNRNASVRKMYHRLYNNATVPAGDVQRWSGDFIFVRSVNIFDLYSL